MSGENQSQELRDIELEDIQGLLRYGHGRLTETRFLLLNIENPDAARQWLAQAPVTTAQQLQAPPKDALQLAFSVEGLRALQLEEDTIAGFSDEFITGMSGDESRSRRLGDIGDNAPQHWNWGGADAVPHMLLLMYSLRGGLAAAAERILDDSFHQGFAILQELPTGNQVTREPFGFVDGISQPRVDWAQEQSTDLHDNDHYTNWIAPGEIMLGYRNEYGLYTQRPLIDPAQDKRAVSLSDAEDQPGLKDFARNGSYLVIRQLHQDVEGFWRYCDQQAGSSARRRDQLAARMVGRKRDGTPIAPRSLHRIPGIDPGDAANHFSYDLDRDGEHCPISAHVRRSNPRSGDYPPDVSGFWSRMLRLLGFCQQRDDEDLVASSRYHRLLRRGRAYGPIQSPAQVLKPDAETADRGLQFICLVANISRQFEFVQNAWNMRAKFAGLRNDRDPLIGTREPLSDGTRTDHFHSVEASGVTREYPQLPQFVSVIGGGYFFMPGVRALRYLAAVGTDTDKT